MTSKFPIPHSELARVLLSFKGVLFTVGAFSAVINVLLLVPSLYMLQVYDRALPSRSELTLTMLTLMMLGAYLVMCALELLRGFILIRVGARLDMLLNKRVYGASFEHNLKGAGGNTSQALHDLTSIRQFLTGNGMLTFFDAPWFPVYIVVIFLFKPSLGVFALCGAALLVALAFVNERLARAPLAEANATAIASSALAASNLRNAEVIEAMGMLPQLQARWFRLHGRFLRLQAEASEKAAVVGAATRFVRIALQSLVLGFGAYLAIEGSISPGMMIAASILVGRALAPLEALIGSWKQWNGARSAYQRLDRLLEQNPPRQPTMALPKPLGALTLDGVSAAPPGAAAAVLKGLSFALAPGDALGVIGPSGAGKSTLARLLVGVWPAQLGKVRLDGADLHAWNKEELGPHIGYLPQDVELFAGSVSDNICRFGPADAEQVITAATRGGVHEMILQLPNGYDSVLGEGGAGLSGGQIQRIGLARAMYGDPSLIVLDEPNANLDDSGERALLAALADWRRRGKTVVLITHRTGIIGATNKLLLLQNGAAQLFGPTARVLEEMAKPAQARAQAAQAAPARPAGAPANQPLAAQG